MANPVHLSDVFRSGLDVEVQAPNYEDPNNPLIYTIWMQRPAAHQHEEAMNKARAKQARIRRQYTDKESDEYVSMWLQVADFEELDDLVESLLAFSENDHRQKAYNEILFSKEVGSDWGPGGSRYLDLLGAVADRMDWILKHNEELAEEDDHLRVWPENDEELLALQAEADTFEKEVEVRMAEMKEAAIAELKTHSTEALRKRLFKKMVDTEAGLAWLQEYRTLMVFYACRYSDDHRRLYFKSPESLWELPDSVRSQLFNAWQDLDAGTDDIKNSLSLLPS
jgi:hypothetical protein